MGVINSLRSLLGRSSKQTISVPLSEYSLGKLIGSDVDIHPIRGKRARAENYSGWIFAASSFIAEKTRALDWVLWKQTGASRDEWTRDDRHAFNQFLRRPNATDTWGDLLERSVVSFNTAGEFYWHLIRNGQKAIGFELLLPHWVNEPVIEDGTHTGWRVAVPGRAPTILPIEDVIRVYRPHPLNPWLAASVVEAAAVSHYFDLYVRAYGMTVFRNDAGIPAGLLSSDQQLTKEQADFMRENWRQRYAGTRGEVAVLGHGTKYQPVGVPLGDLRFLDLGAFNKDQVLQLFRVPASLLGADSAGVNRATIEGHLYSFESHALHPIAIRLQETINARLMPAVLSPADAATHSWEFVNVVSLDRTRLLAESEKSLAAGAITINEYRQKLDFDPVPDGDVYLVPNKAKLVETLKPIPPPAQIEGDRSGLQLVIAAAARRADLAEQRADLSERRADLAQQRADAAQAQADLLRVEAAERRTATALRGLFARWWRDRNDETISMTGLEPHGLTTDDLPPVREDETLREWIERLKDLAPELATVATERGEAHREHLPNMR